MRRLRFEGMVATVAKVASLALGGFLVAVIMGSGASGAFLSALDDTNPTTTTDVATLSVEKSSPEYVGSGAEFNYTVDVTNTGDATATDVRLRDALPDNVDLVSPGEGCVEEDGNEVVVCDVGQLDPTDTFSAVIRVKAPEDGDVENTAEASASNAQTAEDSVTTEVGNTIRDLEIEKSAPGTVQVDDVFDYDIEVSNRGTVSMDDVTVSDELPDGLTFVGASEECDETEGIVDCSLGQVDVDDSRTLAITVRADTAGTKVNTATVDSEESENGEAPNSDSATTEVEAEDADLEIEKSAPESATVGDEFDYEIEVTNLGEVDMTEVTVTDELPNGVTFEGASEECDVSENIVECDLGTVDYDDSETVTISVRATTPGVKVNTAEVESDVVENGDGANEDSASTTVEASEATDSDVLYTTDADFDEGLLVNVNHSASANQLQLNTSSGTFPFIWIALSQRCTIAKINTETGAILGEFRTIPDQASCNESSRTTVGIDGSVWVGHRGPGGITHVGLAELNQCTDRNGNGAIETSSGYGDVKAWPSVEGFAIPADECILHHVDTDTAMGTGGSVDSRHMSIDKNNKLWVGSWNSGGRFIRIDGTTGEIETAAKDLPCGGYGGLIDGNGVIWSAQGSLLRWDPNAPDNDGNPRCISGTSLYGIAVDADGWIWANQFGSQVRKVSPDGNTILGPFSNGSGTGSQGLAVDSNGDVWISSSLNCSNGCTIGHLKNDGTFVGNVSTPTGSGSTGIAVDAAGKVWAANRASNTATRIDPSLGELGCGGTGCGDGTHVGAVDLTVDFPATPGRPLPYPYNYSDMTGAQLFNSTAPQGTWTVVQDGAVADAAWGKITWNTEPQASVPSGSSITVEARAADSEAGLGSETYVSVANATTFNLTGRYIQVRVTMRPNDDALSPVLSDIHICSSQSSCAGAPPRPTTQAGPSTPVARTFQPTPPPSEPGTFNGQVISGVVLYNGQPIRGVIELKSGDVIDATNGRIEIVTVSGRAEFYEGAFKITQPTSANAFTRLELVGGDFSICGARKTSAVRADDKPVRRLWGKGTGKFETKARYSAATVRGTTWLTQDRCDGSLTFSEQGTVGVFDFSLRRTRVLTSGLQYLAEPPPPPTPGNFVGEIKGQVIVNGVPLEQDTQIRSGDTVDVRGGRITLTTTSGAASFFSGRFLVTQTGGSSAFTLLTLVGGDFSGCTTRSRSTSANSADPPKKAVRSLWGTGTGKFQTKSRFSAATVRGTNWLTVDRCDGSLTVVREGTVELFDITLNRTVLVRAGKQYLAPAQRP